VEVAGFAIRNAAAWAYNRFAETSGKLGNRLRHQDVIAQPILHRSNWDFGLARVFVSLIQGRLWAGGCGGVFDATADWSSR
jgi:hypothetical protein